MKGTLAERFWAKVDKKGQGECWEWTGAKVPGDYGVIGKGGSGSGLLLAHRVSWELVNGPIPAGKCVLHRYDNPSCVNPHHLFLGTMVDNQQDMIKKGRANKARGERQGNSKLTEQDVHEIRAMLARDISQTVIAEKYDVARTTIGSINTGTNWGWLKEDLQ